ncbi:MAG TPA: HNH endonuclease [Anaeromyxobacteraceae bacterium]|jgi:hypothetical protein|nr:HNH endonuclease [Anaeromyxobacteraceae bacterium]
MLRIYSHSPWTQIPEELKIMSTQNWQIISGVKVNNEIAVALTCAGLVIEVDEESGYPWVRHRPASWAPGDPPPPAGRVMVLHVYVWNHFMGTTRPIGSGEVIHHKNTDKLDARIKNLGIGSRAQHVESHNRKNRRFSRRKRDNLGGFRHRPPQPAKVFSRAELVGQVVVVERTAPKPRTLGEQLFDIEEKLKGQLPSAMERMAVFKDQGVPIPRAATRKEWREPATRRMGLRMPRMACDEAEAAFVLMLIGQGFDLEAVAQDLGEPVELLRTFLKRVPVNVAIERWRYYRRLPEPCKATVAKK